MTASTAVVFDILARDRASDKFDKLGNSADRSQGKLSKLGSVMKSAAKGAAIGLGIAAVGAGKALFEMGKSAAEDQAAAAKLAQTLKNTTGATDDQIASVEDWISAQGRALGVTDDELRPALQRLAEATGDVGEAQKLASLAMDVSAGTGKSLKTVSEALMKAQNGQISGLSRLGIETKNAAGETLTFEQATKKMADQFGGQAAVKANTLQGKMDRLKLILAETGEEIGAKLIPIATKFAGWMLNDGLPAAEKFGGWLRDNLGPIFSKVGDVWRKVTGAMSGDGNKSIGQIRSVLGDLASTFRSVISIAQSLWKHFGETLTAFTKSSFGAIWQIVRGAFQIIAGIFKTISAVLRGDWSEAWEGIKQILKGAWTVIKGVVKLGFAVLKGLFKVGWTVIKGLTKAAWEGIKKLPGLALDGIKKLVRTALTGYKVMFRAGWDALKTLARSAWDGIKNIVGGGVDRVMNAIKSVPGRIRNLGSNFKEAGKAILGKLIDGLTSVGGFVGDIAKGVKDAVVGAINDVIRAMNAAIPDKISLKGLPDINLPDNPIPTINLARGGIVRARPGGTLARIGEAGHDEAVVPLSGPHAPKVRTSGRESVAPIIVQLRLGGRVVEQLLIEHTQTTGRPLQVRTLGSA